MSRGAFPSPEPGSPVFETFLRVRFHEVDSLGHVNNASYLNYLEQAAIDHATLLGLRLDRLQALGGVFVARRHEIEFLQPAFAGDLLRIVTWLGEPRGARVERSYLVCRTEAAASAIRLAGSIVPGDGAPERDSVVVAAITEWVFVSTAGQPRRIPPEVVASFRAAAPIAGG